MLSPGCVMWYSRYPTPSRQEAPSQISGKLYYRMDGSSIFSDPDAIRRVIKTKSPFTEVEYSEGKADKGFFLDIHIKSVPPSAPAIIFGYLSYATLTLSPSWTTKGGADIIYELYQDGQLLKTFDYQIRHGGFCWLVALPFFWVNFLTPSSTTAYQATAEKVLEEAQPYFTK